MKKYLLGLLEAVIITTLIVGCNAPKEPPKTEEPQVKSETAEAALDFTLQSLKQETFTLSSYRDKQPVLLFFWTTWCPFCRTEIKQLKDEYPQLKQEGWELFAIDVGEPRYTVERFLLGMDLGFNVLLDADGSAADYFGIVGVPTFIIIDKKGSKAFTGHRFPSAQIKSLAR